MEMKQACLTRAKMNGLHTFGNAKIWVHQDPMAMLPNVLAADGLSRGPERLLEHAKTVGLASVSAERKGRLKVHGRTDF